MARKRATLPPRHLTAGNSAVSMIPMLRLYVLRHAKTAWALPGQRDYDRQLNERGIADLDILRHWTSEFRIQPAHVYCSPAARTRATFDGISKAFKSAPGLDMPDILYSGSLGDYAALLRAHSSPEPLMIVGHNPSCANLVDWLTGSGEEADVEFMRSRYPTGTLSVIDIDKPSWSEIGEGCGHLSRFLTPKAWRGEAA